MSPKSWSHIFCEESSEYTCIMSRMTGANIGECRRWQYLLIVLRAESLSLLNGEVWGMMNSQGKQVSLVVFLSIWVGLLVEIKVMRVHWPWQRLLWSFNWRRAICYVYVIVSLNKKIFTAILNFSTININCSWPFFHFVPQGISFVASIVLLRSCFSWDSPI